MEFNKVIYHGECHCLVGNGNVEDDRCLKRFFTVNHLFDYKPKVAVCSSYLRLLIHNETYSQKHDWYNSIPTNIIGIILLEASYKIEHREKLITDSDFYKRGLYRQTRFIGDIYMGYSLCERPHITTHISMIDAIRILVDMRYIGQDNDFYTKFIYELNRYLRDIEGYKKYKANALKVKSLLYKIKQTSGDEFHSNLIELTLFINNLITNEK